MRISKRQLKRIIREERVKLYEDSIDDELDNLKKNIGDDIEHIRDLKDDEHEDHEEELRAEKEKERHDESFRRRKLRRNIRRLVREEHDADWGMGSHEQSRTHSGEDYTGHAGDESRSHPGELDYEGDDVESKAHAAVAAIQDLASAAGVELDTDTPALGDDDVELAQENLRRRIRKIVRENTRRPFRRMRRRR